MHAGNCYNRDSVFSQDENGELQYATIQGNDVSYNGILENTYVQAKTNPPAKAGRPYVNSSSSNRNAISIGWTHSNGSTDNTVYYSLIRTFNGHSEIMVDTPLNSVFSSSKSSSSSLLQTLVFLLILRVGQI